MKIRKARKEDLKDIAEILRVESGKKPYFQKHTKKGALEKIENSFKKDDIYMSELDGEVVGFIICKETKDKKSIYIDEFWFKEEHQAKGFGTKLLKSVERVYKKLGWKRIDLISSKISRAFGFYKKMKYKPHSEFIFLEKRLL